VLALPFALSAAPFISSLSMSMYLATFLQAAFSTVERVQAHLPP
jgi:NADPH-dependent 7-cyano-7-deazaguanine reductase QueF-like protein